MAGAWFCNWHLAQRATRLLRLLRLVTGSAALAGKSLALLLQTARPG